MAIEDIEAKVASHYASSRDPFLLSDLGIWLRDAGLWPIEGETRTLADFIGSSGMDLELVRDPKAAAYVIVVPSALRPLAEAAIQHRRDVRFLAALPRSALLAFCVESEVNATVYLRRTPPFTYSVGFSNSDPAFVPVEEEFRIRGLYLRDIRSAPKDDLRRLSDNIHRWAERHRVSLEQFLHKEKPEIVENSPPTAPPAVGHLSNALERLFAAQPAELSAKLIVPIDIALTLSRIP